MNRLVCDTNIVLSGLLWNGSPRQVLIRIEKGISCLFTCRTLLEELDRVLHYPKLAGILGEAGVARQDILRWMVQHSTMVMPKPLGQAVVRADPSDDCVLACAVAAAADAIISGDKHLLELRLFRGIPIMSANSFLRKLG